MQFEKFLEQSCVAWTLVAFVGLGTGQIVLILMPAFVVAFIAMYFIMDTLDSDAGDEQPREPQQRGRISPWQST